MAEFKITIETIPRENSDDEGEDPQPERQDIDVKASSKVLDIKLNLWPHYTSDLNTDEVDEDYSYRLIFQGEHLDDEKLLSDYGIVEGDTITHLGFNPMFGS